MWKGGEAKGMEVRDTHALGEVGMSKQTAAPEVMYDAEVYGGEGGFVWCTGGRERYQKWRRTFTHARVAGMKDNRRWSGLHYASHKGVIVGVGWVVSPILLEVGKRVLAGSKRWS